MRVELLNYPDEKRWFEVKERALVTIGKKAVTPPTEEWKKKMLRARHSPIRHLEFSFYIECESFVSVHCTRHKHAEPYVKSQRNDRQKEYDRKAARQDAPVCMIWDINGEEMIKIANKRLCGRADPDTRALVAKMCELVIEKCPEFNDELIPMCGRENKCYEMEPCGYYDAITHKNRG